jgi:DNA phosphorothioation-dependent restriction protein DptG
MDYDKLYEDFKRRLDKMSDQDLIDAFARLGCEVYIDEDDKDAVVER